MRKSTAISLALVVATLAPGVPVWLAIHESERQGLDDVTARALGYAQDILLRADETADQVERGVERLAAAQNGDPCSDANIKLMRQIDLSSGYLQAIGFVDKGRIVCSSFGRASGDLFIGAPRLDTANGMSIHKRISFSFAQQQSFIALGRKNYVAIIHKDVPINTTTSEKNVSLAVFSLADAMPLTSRGFVDADWLKRLGPAKATTFLDGGYVVAVTRSSRYKYAAVAAVPTDYVAARTRKAERRLVPVGLLAGVALAGSVFLLARTQLSISSAIRAGLRRQEFFLLYQPIVDLRTGEWVGAEALIRWRNSLGELIEPDFFIPVAEQSGQTAFIAQRVLELLAGDAGAFLKHHPHFHVAINLSAADLHAPQLPAQLDAFLAQTGAAPGNLSVELTERAFIDVGVARAVLRELRARGFAVSIDDFGTGYSSLSYLETLEVDHVKIDRSFIEAIDTDAPISHVVQHIIKMARSLRLQLIAEGVETEGQAQFLRQRGVEYAQGWLFGKPMAFADIERHFSWSARGGAARGAQPNRA